MLFAGLFWLVRGKRALQRPGLIAGAYLVGYGLARSSSELFREPDYSHIFTIAPLTPGILYSLPMIIAGVLVIGTALRRATLAPVSKRTALILSCSFGFLGSFPRHQAQTSIFRMPHFPAFESASPYDPSDSAAPMP